MGVEKLEKPAEPRGCKGEGGHLERERVISARLTWSRRSKTSPGWIWPGFWGSERQSACVWVWVWVCVRACIPAHLVAHWTSPSRPQRPSMFADLGSTLQQVGGAQEQGQTYPGCAQTQLSRAWPGRTLGLVLPRDLCPFCGELCFISYLHYFPTHSPIHRPQNCLRTLLSTKVSGFSQNFV